MTARPFAVVSFALSLCGAALGTPAARAQSAATAGAGAPAAATALTPAQAQQALELLQDEAKRNQLIATLRAIAEAQPAAAPGAGAPAAAAPATAAAPGAAKTAASPVPLAPNGLGAQLLTRLSAWLDDVSALIAQVATASAEVPLMWRWPRRVVNDPAARAAVLDAAWRVLLAIGAALAVEQVVRLILRRPIRALARHAPSDADDDGGGEPSLLRRRAVARAWRLLRRLPLAIARLLLELVPIALFATAGNLLPATGIGTTGTVRLVTLALVESYVLARVIMSVARMLLSPGLPQLRLLHVGDRAAGYLARWTRRIVVVAVFGGGLAEVALLLGLDEAAHDTLVRLIALAVAVMLLGIVIQCRARVAAVLRPGPERRDGVARLRGGLADTWLYLAVAAIVLGWLIWSAGIRTGLGGLRFLIGTAAILFGAKLVAIVALGTLDRVLRFDPEAARFPGLDARLARYDRPVRMTVRAAIGVATALALLELWGVSAFSWFQPGTIGRRLFSAIVTVAIAAIVAVIIWESANAALERRLARLSREDAAARAARLRTLLPILRTALLAAILTIIGLTALSEIGVNVAPLLAGAGIVGVALGFGSQKLVQDFITGMFLLLENAIQVGDWVTAAGLSGSVEQLSVRTIWLRAADGSVHVIPFSAVTTLTNTDRGVGNAAISVIVAFKEDTDRVGAVLKEIAAGLRDDPAFGPLMLGELQLWGVDQVRAAGVTLTGQIKCTDAGRWTVQREFNRRMKKRFQELDIQLGEE